MSNEALSNAARIEKFSDALPIVEDIARCCQGARTIEAADVGQHSQETWSEEVRSLSKEPIWGATLILDTSRFAANAETHVA